MDAKDTALTKAKIGILKQGTLFMSTLTFNLKHEWDNTINPPTACTNGSSIKYHPDFFMQLTHDGRVFLIAHEVWHVALDHITRGTNLDCRLFYKAADYVINNMLVEAGFKMPTIDGEAVGLYDICYKGMSTEQVYALLKNDPAHKQNADRISILDGDITPPKSSESKQIQEHIKLLVNKAVTASKVGKDKTGSIPGEVAVEIDKLLNPKLPWQTILNRFLSTIAKNNYSWKRPNKRFFPELILPSLYSTSLPHIAVATDTSGSLIDPKQQAEIRTEIRQIHKLFKPELLTIVTADYEIHDIYKIKPTDKIENLVFHGGGGTSFYPVIEYFKKNKPTLLIYFTDLYAQPIEEDPGFPIIWICNSNHEKAKIGKTIYMEPHE